MLYAHKKLNGTKITTARGDIAHLLTLTNKKWSCISWFVVEKGTQFKCVKDFMVMQILNDEFSSVCSIDRNDWVPQNFHSLTAHVVVFIPFRFLCVYSS